MIYKLLALSKLYLMPNKSCRFRNDEKESLTRILPMTVVYWAPDLLNRSSLLQLSTAIRHGVGELSYVWKMLDWSFRSMAGERQRLLDISLTTNFVTHKTRLYETTSIRNQIIRAHTHPQCHHLAFRRKAASMAVELRKMISWMVRIESSLRLFAIKIRDALALVIKLNTTLSSLNNATGPPGRRRFIGSEWQRSRSRRSPCCGFNSNEEGHQRPRWRNTTTGLLSSLLKFNNFDSQILARTLVSILRLLQVPPKIVQALCQRRMCINRILQHFVFQLPHHRCLDDTYTALATPI